MEEKRGLEKDLASAEKLVTILARLGTSMAELRSSQAGWEKGVEAIAKDFNKTGAEVEKVLHSVHSLKKPLEGMAKGFFDAFIAIKDSNGAVQEVEASVQDLNAELAKNLNAVQEGVEGWENQERQLHRVLDNLGKYTQQESVLGKYQKARKFAIAEDLKKMALKVKSNEALTTAEQAQVRSLKNELKAMEDLNAEAKEYAETRVSGISKAIGAMRGLASDFSELKGGLKGGFGSQNNQKLGDKFAAKAKQLEDPTVAAAGIGGKIGGEVMGSLMKGASFFAKKLLGPIGFLLEAVDKLKELDAFQKEATNEFAKIAGPQFNGKAFAEEASKYNDAIFSVQRNLKLGVDYKEWQQMFSAFNNAGISVTGLKDRVGDYGKVQDIVKKSSLEFGTDLTTMGGDFADAMLASKGPIEEVADGFNFIAQGAKSAGMSATKFYGVIQQSTLALGTYGNFMKVASKSLQTFIKSGLSQKDAEDASGSTGEMFTKNPIEGIGTMELAKQGLGPKGITDLFTRERDSQKGKMDKLAKDGKADSPEYNQLLLGVKTLTQAIESPNDSLKGSAALPYLKKEQGAMVSALLSSSKLKGGLSDTKNWDVLAQYSKLSYKAIQGLASTQMAYMDAISKVTDKMQDLGAKGTDFSDLDKIMADPQKATEEAVNAALDKYEKLGVSKDFLRKTMNDPTQFKKLMVFWKKGEKATDKDLEGISKDVVASSMDADNTLGDKSLKGQDEMVDSLTSVDKSMGITADGMKWLASNNDATKAANKLLLSISTGVGNIFGWMTKSSTDKALATKVDGATVGGETKTVEGLVATIPAMLDNLKNAKSHSKDMESRIAGNSAADLKKKIEGGDKDLAEYLSAIGINMKNTESTIESDLSKRGTKEDIANKYQEKMQKTYARALTAGASHAESNIGAVDSSAKPMVQNQIDALNKGLADLPLATAPAPTAPANPDAKKSTGGFVPGTSKVGDRVQVGLNSGELVLTEPETHRMFAALKSGSMSTAVPSVPATQQGGTSAPVTMYNTIQVTGTTGEEVATAIDRKLKQFSYKQSTT